MVRRSDEMRGGCCYIVCSGAAAGPGWLIGEVLLKAREEVLRELINCGQNGGVGRANTYAPQLTNLQKAIETINVILQEEEEKPVDKMAAVRAAKTTKTQGQ